MKLKKVRIVVETVDRTETRWLAAMRGTAKSNKNEEVITVGSWDILGRVFSPPRLQILTAIPLLKPKSISALAKAIKKDFKNVYSDVMFLADLGLIDLREEGARKTVAPVAKFSEIEFALAA